MGLLVGDDLESHYLRVTDETESRSGVVPNEFVCLIGEFDRLGAE
ncbi:MAG: hypothetical protein ACI9TI_001053 [Natronomonas sp.]|jgi:hypothetical protein